VALDLITRYRIATPSPQVPIATLSGGNVQRTVLARELSDAVQILLVANPCFGLDIAATAAIRSQIMAMHNQEGAVLLVSEDLVHLHRSFYAIGLPVLYWGYETTTLYPTLDR
jgi:simple sugar transport system ATP-binding protein